jgi:lipopolysaccharide biosynthesis glycosyltransferase
MKKLIYQVYVGKPSKLYDYCTNTVKAYADKIGADYICQTTPTLKIKPDVFATNRSTESYEKHGGFLPIFEKENAFEYLKEYDQVAIIDADIMIKESAPDIFKEIAVDSDFAGVVEREMPITDQYKQKINNYSKMQYGMLHNNKMDFKPNNLGFEFFNMGLMVMNKSITRFFKPNETPKDFLMRSEFKNFVDGMGAWKWSTDQTLLNTWVKKEKMKVTHLDWKWNALYSAVKSDKIKDAHFIHFFLKDLLPNRGENVKDLIASVG